MNKFFISILVGACSLYVGKTLRNATADYSFLPTSPDSTLGAVSAPPDLVLTTFADANVVPSPACLASSAWGELFVGVDMMGSLGKQMGKGQIVKLVDTNNDGKWDKKSVFAQVDNPRGILPVADKVFVLHTVFSAQTKTATGMALVVFEDKNKDGIADGPAQNLLTGISSRKFIQTRGTDHATNGIRMGIDGWIYIAVGDFGFYQAKDRSGKVLTQLGGGIVRIRPDGTEAEVYTHGLRNVYDVAIDPYLNIFTRDNTNDGGGWNVRFSHQIQTGEYGYPVFFKHFTEEIIPALADLGGGSGTGALFLNDSRWPAKYNNLPLTADWGRSALFMHRLTKAGATFTQVEESFIKLPQVTDVDMDASGRMYISAWDGAGYSGSPDKGFVVRAVPKDFNFERFADLRSLSPLELSSILTSGSAAARLAAQQEMLSRTDKKVTEVTAKLMRDRSLSIQARVAALYTFNQAAGQDAIQQVVELSSDPAMRVHALRALSDRKGALTAVPLSVFLKALDDSSATVRAAALIGLGRLGNKAAASRILQVSVPTSFTAPAKGSEGPHADANPDIVLAHLAVRALVSLHAEQQTLSAIHGKNPQLAFWVLRYMHSPGVVSYLLKAYPQFRDSEMKDNILVALARLYKKEAPYDGSRWWGTRPDTHGPYYYGILWQQSAAIRQFLIQELQKQGRKEFFADLNDKFRLDISELGTNEEVAIDAGPKVDLEKIKKEKGQIGETSIEDVMLAIDQLQGDAGLGEKIFQRQGCIACHSISADQPMKGPFMGQIGSIMNRQQIAESILKPDASISQGFVSVSVTTKSGESFVGFVSEESPQKLVLRDIAGNVNQIKASDIVKKTEMPNSMMPTGLANSLTFQEFASLLAYLERQKK